MQLSPTSATTVAIKIAKPLPPPAENDRKISTPLDEILFFQEKRDSYLAAIKVSIFLLHLRMRIFEDPRPRLVLGV